jgi:hypothetical protein
MLFFRWTMEAAPPFIALHFEQHLKCLSQFFDVTLIDTDCDYKKVCDRYQPDISLFESGVYAGTSDRRIVNVSAYPEIPKVGFCNADGFCFSRQVFFSDMERWGVETFFALSLVMAEYTPEIADRLFVWPNCIDADLYKDYGSPKVIPVSITGSQASLYPWRNRISRMLAERYPCLVSPHFGWTHSAETARMIHGEPYARMLNASWMVPSCGTMAKDLVRKHLEIPGSRTCLITERTPAVEAAGFVDMKNCVFADESDLVDKVDWLFGHQDELQRLVDAGYELVHAKHTMQQRDQLRQWLELHRSLRPGQTIVQAGPFEPLAVADTSQGIRNGHVTRDGIDRVLLRAGDKQFLAKRYDEAEALYRQCLNYYPLSEPKLRLALVSLRKGNAADALDWIREPIARTLGQRRSLDPDPVEWAYFVVALLCDGQVTNAFQRSRQFPALRHPELDRIRQMVSALMQAPTAISAGPRRHTIHQLPERTAPEWIDDLCAMLVACRRDRLADSVRKASKSLDQDPAVTGPPAAVTSEERERALPLTPRQFIPAVQATVHHGIESARRRLVSPLERWLGPFMPYRFSIARNDEFLATVENIGRHHVERRALLLGASAGVDVTEAFLAGIRGNQRCPSVLCVNRASVGFSRLRRRYARSEWVRCITSDGSRLHADITGEFDVVIVDGSDFPWHCDHRMFESATLVVLDDVNERMNSENRRWLVESQSHRLLQQDPARRSGYAVFQKFTQQQSA